MDPVLSSTAEFDAYLQSKLSISGRRPVGHTLSGREGGRDMKGAAADARKGSGAVQAPKPRSSSTTRVSRSRLEDSSKGNPRQSSQTRATIEREKGLKDDSSKPLRRTASRQDSKTDSGDFLQMNIRKYGESLSTHPRSAVPARSTAQAVHSTHRRRDSERPSTVVPAVRQKQHQSWMQKYRDGGSYSFAHESRSDQKVIEGREHPSGNIKKNNFVEDRSWLFDGYDDPPSSSSSGPQSFRPQSAVNDDILSELRLNPPKPTPLGARGNDFIRSNTSPARSERNSSPASPIASPKPVPKSKSDISRWPAYNSTHSPPSVHRSTASSFHRQNYLGDSIDDFDNFKIRHFCLKRIFQAWATEAKLNSGIAKVNVETICKRVTYWRRKSCLQWWKLLYCAVEFSQRDMRYKARRWLHRWVDRTRCRLRGIEDVEIFVFNKYAVLFFKNLHSLVHLKALRMKRRNLRRKATEHRNRSLLQSVLRSWKQQAVAVKCERQLDVEHQERIMKISAFMNRLTAKAEVGEKSAQDPRNSISEAKPDHVLRKVVKKTAAGDAVGPSRLTRLAQRKESQRSGVLAKDEDDEPRQMDGDKERALEILHDSTLTSSMDCADSKLTTPPPPSYGRIMQGQQKGSRNTAEAFPIDANTTPLPQPPIRKARTTNSTRNDTETKGSGKKRNANEESAPLDTLPANYDSMTFEERAQVRKERTQLLRKQAQERINKKQQELKQQEQEKERQESAAAVREQREYREQQLRARKEAEQTRATMLEVFQQKNTKAKEFRRVQLLVRFGMAPWQQYLELHRLNYEKAVRYDHDRLVMRSWSTLLGYVIAAKTDRMRREHRNTAVAVAHYRRRFLKVIIKYWKLYFKSLKARAKAVSGHFSTYTLCRRSFQGWRIAYERNQRKLLKQMRALQPRGDRCTRRYYWRKWVQFLQMQLEEREIKRRLDNKWSTVQSWLNRK